jgi:hypothetical protein
MKTREQAVAEKGAWGNPDTMSTNPKEDNMKDNELEKYHKRVVAWTVQDEAIHRGHNYADHIEKQLTALREDGATLHALLKNAFTDGFLYGFEHKFDDTHYEEK